jgi:hypothetical protein
MNLNEIHKSLEKIGSVSITTLDGNTMHSRIISICGGDEEGIYFLTMNVEAVIRCVHRLPLSYRALSNSKDRFNASRAKIDGLAKSQNL